MRNKEKDCLLAHTITNIDPQICVDRVNEFNKGKDLDDRQIIYSTTVIVIGTKQVPFLVAGKPAQVPIINAITSCLITWYGTKKEREEWDIERVKLQQEFINEQTK